MNDRNLYRAMLLAFALVTAVHAASSDAALPATGAGALDPTFGNGNGVVTTTASNGNWSVGAVLQGDGKFVVSCAIESKNGTFTFAVKRVYNNRFPTNDSNHRYATSDSIYDQMVAQGWSGEGTVFCAPR